MGGGRGRGTVIAALGLIPMALVISIVTPPNPPPPKKKNDAAHTAVSHNFRRREYFYVPPQHCLIQMCTALHKVKVCDTVKKETEIEISFNLGEERGVNEGAV